MPSKTRTIRRRLAGLGVAILVFAVSGSAAAAALDGVTFAVEPGKVFLPAAEAAARLKWKLEHDEQRGTIRLNGVPMPPEVLRSMRDGTILVSVNDLGIAGATVTVLEGGRRIRAAIRWRAFTVAVGEKRVEIDLAAQRLEAWQGDRLVLESRISSGRWNSTPAGEFTAGPYKARRHFSKRYNNAPMPWSVQVTGHVFIHGFTSVPRYPASHGCIRLPLDEGNPARFFYEWIDAGTPVRITRE